MNDMFALEISGSWIEPILEHCHRYKNNTYVFQTKNPNRVFKYKEQRQMPDRFMLGTTIESNKHYPNISKAPAQQERYEGMLKFLGFIKFITIEPILDFDVDILVEWVEDIHPDFVNIGADSKRCNLPEPPKEKVQELIKKLQEHKITIKKKINLDRILSNDKQIRK